jgi:hypothetical protein
VGWSHKSAIRVNGYETTVRFKGFGFENGNTGTLNDTPLALYQKGSLWNPFAPVYRIDLELEQKGLENFQGYPLREFEEVQMHFDIKDANNYIALQQPFLYENISYTPWRKVNPSRRNLQPLSRNEVVNTIAEAGKAKAKKSIRGGLSGGEAYYHASSLRGIDLDLFKGFVDPEQGQKYPSKFVIIPGRIDTNNITKISGRFVWTQNVNSNPASVYEKWEYALAPRAAT